MQQHVYNICNILSVLRLKACKRTYKAINARRTENAEKYTHTFNRTQNGATWKG